MIKREEGFTIVELMLTMTLFVLTIAAASAIFVPLLTQFKQQSKSAESQIEGIIGLELLRRDIEQAGLGLPWVIQSDVTAAQYSEASAATTGSIPAPNLYNDSPGVPRAIVSGNDIAGLGTANGSDYLVIKATSIGLNDTAPKWTYVIREAAGVVVRDWGSTAENLANGNRVIVLIPSRGENNQRILYSISGVYSVNFNPAFDANYSPVREHDLYIIYGVDPNTNLRMPFNRAEYYIRSVSGTTIPSRCAAGTGVLMKSVIAHGDGGRGPGISLMDCVADFQVVYGLDRDVNGTVDSYTGLLTDATTGVNLTPRQIRDQLKEVRLYILSQEGQKDPNFQYCPNPADCNVTTLAIPAAPDPGAGAGRNYNFNTSGITDWRNYRWKLYTIVVKPKNLI